MSSLNEPSSLCSVHSIHSCTGFLNERLAALGLSPKLLLPFGREEPLRRKRPLAERNAGEHDQSARLMDGDGIERALAEALNVIFDLVKELERQPYKAQYYAEQVRALRTETETQHASAERIREEKHQLRADYGKLKQLAEREREQHRRAAEAASRDLEALRRQNAELSIMKWKAEGQVKQLQAELAQLRRHFEKKYESTSRHSDAFPRRSTQVQVIASSSSHETPRTLSKDGAEQMEDQNHTDTTRSAHSVKAEKKAFKQQRKMRNPDLVSHETEANLASGESEKFSHAPKNQDQANFAEDELVNKEQLHEATRQTITTEVEALRRECEWLRHQLDWYRGIVSEQEELLAYAIEHR